MRVSKLLGLVPSVIQESQITTQQLTDLVDLYKDYLSDYLPSPQLFFAEFERRKMKVQARIITADSCVASLKHVILMISPTCTFFSRLRLLFRDIGRVRAFNQHNEKAAAKAKQLREMYHGRD